jgi:pimeloyl-ACP methyl ester carboxylesterase
MNDKENVVFLPGLLCDERLWRDQVAALSDDYNTSIVDMTLDDSINAMATRVLDSSPDRFALVALSMGGYVSFEVMRLAHERVTHLALFATSAAPDNAHRAAQRRASVSSLRFGKFVGVTKRLLPKLIHPDRVETPLGDEVREMADRVGSEAYTRQQEAILGRIDSHPVLASIKVPTLIAVGDNDVMTPPSHSFDMHRAIANSSLHVFGRCGHLPPMEYPDNTSALLRLLLSS